MRVAFSGLLLSIAPGCHSEIDSAICDTLTVTARPGPVAICVLPAGTSPIATIGEEVFGTEKQVELAEFITALGEPLGNETRDGVRWHRFAGRAVEAACVPTGSDSNDGPCVWHVQTRQTPLAPAVVELVARIVTEGPLQDGDIWIDGKAKDHQDEDVRLTLSGGKVVLVQWRDSVGTARLKTAWQ